MGLYSVNKQESGPFSTGVTSALRQEPNEEPHLIAGPEFEQSFAGIEDRFLMGHINNRGQDPREASRPPTTKKQTSTWNAKQSGPSTAYQQNVC